LHNKPVVAKVQPGEVHSKTRQCYRHTGKLVVGKIQRRQLGAVTIILIIMVQYLLCHFYTAAPDIVMSYIKLPVLQNKG
jgi:hypothetical protein